MKESFEERKIEYIEQIRASYAPEERSWWQYPGPQYHLTSEFARDIQRVDRLQEPVLFKKERKEGVIAVILFVVAAILLYMVADHSVGFNQIIILTVLLLVVLPILLRSRTIISVGHPGIGIDQEKEFYAWQNIVVTYIRELREEKTKFFLIIHFYKEETGEFKERELELGNSLSPEALASAIESFKPSI